jgi:hypothetical protein
VARPEHGQGQRTSGARTSATVSTGRWGLAARDPTRARIAVTHQCFDPLQNGVWVVDLSSGDADHIVTGNPGPAKSGRQTAPGSTSDSLPSPAPIHPRCGWRTLTGASSDTAPRHLHGHPSGFHQAEHPDPPSGTRPDLWVGGGKTGIGNDRRPWQAGQFPTGERRSRSAPQNTPLGLKRPSRTRHSGRT